jgi:hypothetical protein
MKYLKHLIECQCILPQYKKQDKVLFHKFPVFSLFKENVNQDFSQPIEKYVKCNNCDAVHRVYDICKSELLKNSDNYVDLVTNLEDLKYSIPAELIEILSKNQMDIADYEMCSHLIEEKGSDKIILSKKVVGNNIVCKFLIFTDGKFSVKQQTFQKDMT